MGTRVRILAFLCVFNPAALYGQVTTLSEAIRAAEANNRAIKIAELERAKTVRDVHVARTRRLPVFSVTTLGSQPLTQLGITLQRGSLGVYPNDGPIPGRTTTLEDPLRLGFIGFGSVTLPLTQQYKIGLGIDLSNVGVEAAAEQVRAKRQVTVNEVRRLYYGLVQAESSRKTLQTTIDFLTQLEHETSQQVMQRVALKADLLSVKAQLTEAEYDLLKMDDPIQTQKAQLNRLMGRAVDAPLEIDPAAAAEADPISLEEAYTEALASRPEIRLARIQRRKAELERRITSAGRIPDVSLSFSILRTVNFSSVLPNNVSTIGIQAAWDVFDWGRRRQETEAKDDAVSQSALDVQEAEALVMIDVGHAHRRIAEARKELELARALQSSSVEALRVTCNRYAQRETVLSEVARIESRVADADRRYTQALMDLATAQADFDKAIGRGQ